VIRRRALPTLLIFVACVIAGCGSGEPTLVADTEGVYLDLGQLHYQIQLSRQLNPADPEDVAYLRGLSPADAHLSARQAFFAVWIRVENRTDRAQQPAQSFEVADTRGNVYRPLFPDATNLLAYRSQGVPAHSKIPAPGSLAESSPTQGSVLLFKVDVAAYDNRPLTLTIANPASGQSGHADLDV
jgi:hypothetical protein